MMNCRCFEPEDGWVLRCSLSEGVSLGPHMYIHVCIKIYLSRDMWAFYGAVAGFVGSMISTMCIHMSGLGLVVGTLLSRLL